MHEDLKALAGFQSDSQTQHGIHDGGIFIFIKGKYVGGYIEV